MLSKWRRLLLIRAHFLSRREMQVTMHTPLTIVDRFGIKISGFTPSSEALGCLLKNNNNDENSISRVKVCMDP